MPPLGNDDCDNSSYTLTDAPTPKLLVTSLPENNSYIALVYDAGDSSAVWSIIIIIIYLTPIQLLLCGNLTTTSVAG